MVLVTQQFCKELPKVELHAHLNGSLSDKTIKKLLELKLKSSPDFNVKDSAELCLKEGSSRTMEEIFRMFPILQSLTDNPQAIKLATMNVIREFAEDNVKYLELRTTPKQLVDTGMTKVQYIDAVLEGIKEAEKETGTLTNLLLSIDRRQSDTQADETVDLVQTYQKQEGTKVVGMDLSGDPSTPALHLLPSLRRAVQKGIRLSIHVAEGMKCIDETLDLLQLAPDRVGHGTFLRPEVGGSLSYVREIVGRKTPIEICLTSNLKCKTVSSYDSHHLGFWLEKNHPIVLATVVLTTGERSQARTDNTVSVKVNCVGGDWGEESSEGSLEKNSVNRLFYAHAPCAPHSLTLTHGGTNNWEFQKVDVLYKNCAGQSTRCTASPNRYYRSSNNPATITLVCSSATVPNLGYADLITGGSYYAPTDDPVSVRINCAGGQSWGVQTTTRTLKRSSVNRLGFEDAKCTAVSAYVGKPTGDNAWEFGQIRVVQGSCLPTGDSVAIYNGWLGKHESYVQPFEVTLPLIF